MRRLFSHKTPGRRHGALLLFALLALGCLLVSLEPAAAEPGPGSGRYVVSLDSRVEPVDPATLPRLKAFEKYRLYTTRYKGKDRVWYRLRLGFFPTREAAERVMRQLRGTYRTAWVSRVSVREKERAVRIKPGRSASARGSGLKERLAAVGEKVFVAPARKVREKLSGTKDRAASTGEKRDTPGAGKAVRDKLAAVGEKVFVAPARKIREKLSGIKDRAASTSPQKVSETLSEIKKSVTTDKPPKRRAQLEFDHFKTGFPLTGAHELTKCELCHVSGVFTGTPTRCAECHGQGGRISASAKTPDHIPTEATCKRCHSTKHWFSDLTMDHTVASGSCSACHNGRTAVGKNRNHVSSSNNCDECHTTRKWTSAGFNHMGVTGRCSTCHGVSATGKHPNHIKTSGQCDECHSTSTWRGARMDHGNAAGRCSTCHGVTATGKPGNHIQTSGQCDNCHSTSTWLGARMDHSNAAGRCSSCHGVTATGKPTSHIQTSGQCDNCHTSTTSWLSVRFDHTGVTGSCSTCHNGTKARAKPGNHFVTSVQCDGCHSTSGWLPVNRYSHSSGNYPGDHKSSVRCLDCHKSNTQTATWSSAGYKPDCAGCHAGRYKQGPHKKVETPRIYYTVSELRNCAGSCHVYSDSSMTTRIKTRNSKHRSSSGGF